MRYLLSFFLILLFTRNICAQNNPGDYRIYSASLQKEVSIQELVEQLHPGEALIFGEQHDDSIGHLLETAIFKALQVRFGGDLILAMELFLRDVQYIVDEYLAGLISEKNFIKEARAWDSYSKDYKPLVEWAREKGLRVVAANAPARYTNLVTRKGLTALNGLNRDVKRNLIAPLPVDTLKGSYYDRFLETMGGHTIPGMNLYQSQNFWDATMSWSVHQALKTSKSTVVFMMNGRFHSDYHSGMVHRLIHDYKRKVLTISCFASADLEQPDWEKYQEIADFVILTRTVEKDSSAPAAR